MNRIWLIILLVLPSFVLAQEKPEDAAPKRKGTIKGKVLSDDGQPLEGANVNINSIGGSGSSWVSGWRQMQTDDEGNFVADGLAPAPYSVSANSTAYVMPEQPLEPKYHRLGDVVTFTLVKGGVITGRITNALGEPIIAATIRVERIADLEGRKTSGEWWYGQPRKTDDRGVYRVYGLAAGRYIVSVGGKPPYRTGSPTSYESDTPTYYPSATRDGATEVTVNLGEEVRGIDIRYRSEKGYSVSGRVTGLPPDNALLRGGIQVELSHRSPSRSQAASSYIQATDAAKTFELFSVADGEYELVASASGDWQDEAREQYQSPRKRVTVKGGNVTGLELRLLALASVQGKVEWQLTPDKDRAPACQPTRTAVPEETIIMLKPESPSSEVNSNGSWGVPNDKREIRFSGLETGNYRFSANLPDETWYLKSITQKSNHSSQISNLKSQIAVDMGKQGLNLKPGEKRTDIVLTITDGAAGLSGRVTADKNQAMPSRLRVHLIPAEKEAADDLLRYAEQKTKDGSFAFPNLAPGKYWLLARKVPDDEADTKRVNPAAWDATMRKALRAEAEAANQIIELKSCQRVSDSVLRFVPAK